jgi:Uma2 family endonuclease
MSVAIQHPREVSQRPTSTTEPPHVKRWTKEEYLYWVERGLFQGQKLYLFRGELIEMSPMGEPHAVCLMKGTSLLVRLMPQERFFVRVQLPMNAPGESVPEPDFAVCTKEQAFVRPYPATAVLVIEAADSSIAHDREKALEYAAAKVPEYWIIDLPSRRVEIYRNPVPDPTARLGFRYPPPTIATELESIALLNEPGILVKVADLLP